MSTIEERITHLENQLALVMLQIAVLRAGTPAAPPVVGKVADDADLDGQWGDPVICKDPPRWTGASHMGLKYSQCPPDYLDAMAGYLDWCAEKEARTPGKEKYSRYSARDAGRARGWAKRMRGRGTSPTAAVTATQPDAGQQDDFPF